MTRREARLQRDRKLLSRSPLIAIAPLLLAVVELMHPRVGDLLQLDVERWLLVHYAQVPLFALAALSVTTLVRDFDGWSAAVCRVAMFVFAVGYVCFDSVAGIATGLLVRAARASATPAAWRPALDVLWTDPILGSAPATPGVSLAVACSYALLVGTLAAALALRRAGRPLVPTLLLALSGTGISTFDTHAWPGGPLTFGGIAIAVAWLQWSAASRRPG